MDFIKNLFENKVDELTHVQFSRFSKGIFENKAVLDISVSKTIKIKTSSEFVNELVLLLASTIKDKVPVKGIIFSTRDLRKDSDIEFEDVKFAMGVRKHIINSELSKDQILNICNNFLHASNNLSFETEYGSLKIKEKAPKASKPGKGDTNPKADYCVLTTSDKSILDKYAFDIKEPFKKALIYHTYEITSLEVPKEFENNPAEARLKAIRKGKIIRYLIVDGKESTNETNFEA